MEAINNVWIPREFYAVFIDAMCTRHGSVANVALPLTVYNPLKHGIRVSAHPFFTHQEDILIEWHLLHTEDFNIFVIKRG